MTKEDPLTLAILTSSSKCRMESECCFLLGTYFEQVHMEVVLKDKDLLMQNRSRAVPDVIIPQNWL